MKNVKECTIVEAAMIIIDGSNEAAVREITTAAPDFAIAVAKRDTIALVKLFSNDAKFSVLLNGLAKRLEKAADEAEFEDEEPEEAGSDDYASMTKEQLLELCKNRGIKVARFQKPKQYYIDALNNAGKEEQVEEKPAKSTEKKQEAAEEEEADKYAGKTAKELYTMCKERKLKVEPRLASRVYIEALKAADADETGADEDDEDWGDTETEEPAKEQPKKQGRPAKAMAKKEPAKAEEEDEDWEI